MVVVVVAGVVGRWLEVVGGGGGVMLVMTIDTCDPCGKRTTERIEVRTRHDCIGTTEVVCAGGLGRGWAGVDGGW